MKTITLLACLYLLPVTIFAQNWTSFTVDVKQMTSVLNEVKNLKVFPKFDRMPNPKELEGFETCKPEKNDEILNIFSELNRTFFSELKIPLFRCNWNEATGTLLNYGILLSNHEITFLSKNLNHEAYISNLKFLLAHEISHYVHELSTRVPISKKSNYSVNGYPSYTLEKYDVCEMLKREDQKMECELNLWSFGHSEVDIYAALVLKQMGFQDWETVQSGTELLARDILKKESSDVRDAQIHRLNNRFIFIKNSIGQK